jgi:hypothetical protein
MAGQPGQDILDTTDRSAWKVNLDRRVWAEQREQGGENMIARTPLRQSIRDKIATTGLSEHDKDMIMGTGELGTRVLGQYRQETRQLERTVRKG